MIPTELQNFLTLSYGELEELNLTAKAQRQGRVPMHEIACPCTRFKRNVCGT